MMNRAPLPSPEIIAGLPLDGGEAYNRLIHATSPYLLQHATNPVDWYPWGAEAFAEAKNRDVPVFVSIGYSACHWCHVMEQESFEHPGIAGLLNRFTVPVKVDREERPDIDDAMMLVTQAFTGRGGWPNSIWLTPEGRPWYAGTYFPPEDGPGRMGFATLLERLAALWREQRPQVENQATSLSKNLAQYATSRPAVVPRLHPPSALMYLDRAGEALAKTFDARHGGFGGAPKFPPHAALLFLATANRSKPDARSDGMLRRTLDAMMLGGIHDQVGGGFHRYATDERWFLPHYEKMLYDNALLARVYAEASSQLEDPVYLMIAERICDWVLRDLLLEHGLFASSLDADTGSGEGETYLWTLGELEERLGPADTRRFCRWYGCTAEGNAHDEATGKPTGKNLPYLDARLPEKDRTRADALLKVLQEARLTHPQPARDDKAVTAWNGMMIGGLAVTGRIAHRADLIEAAERAAGAVLEHLSPAPGKLMRSWREKPSAVPGFLEDYAAMAWGLADLFRVTGTTRYRDQARELLQTLDQTFLSDTGIYRPTSQEHEALFIPTSDTLDQATPSGNGMACLALASLAAQTGDSRDREQAWRLLDAASGWLHPLPTGTLSYHAALSLLQAGEASTISSSPVPDLSFRKVPLSLEITLTPRHLPIRTTAELVLSLHLDSGWHLQEQEPVTVEIGYPRGLKEAGRSAVDTTFTYRIDIEHSAPTSVVELKLSVAFTACSEERCLPRESLEIRVPVTIIDQG
ncbi:MAG: thioredoxin domain-containing protein [Kiritimatiellae bacterium]|nr:thioredoxin domain-containing protein [Kiritimatiellia bacterium]